MLPSAVWYTQTPVTRQWGEASGAIVYEVVCVEAEIHQVFVTIC